MPVHCHDSESTDDSLISYRVVGVSAVWAISMLVVIFLHVLYYLRVYAKTTWCLALCVSNGKPVNGAVTTCRQARRQELKPRPHSLPMLTGMAWGCAMVILVQVYMSPHMGTSSSYAPYKELYEHSPSYKAIFWSIILSTITTWIMFFRMATWHYSVEATTIYMVRLRRKTVVMLFCFPLMSTMCFVNIWYPSFFVYQELLMCIIDVAVIMLFTAIIAQHLGGWRRTVQFLEQLAPAPYLATPPVLGFWYRCMPDIAFTEELAQCIRYMFIEGMVGLSLVMIIGAIYKIFSGSDNFHLMAAGEAFFVLWTMQALLVIYYATRDAMATIKPGWKIIVLKLYNFIEFIQGIILAIALNGTWLDPDLYCSIDLYVKVWQNGLVSVELMLIMLFIMPRAFPPSDYEYILSTLGRNRAGDQDGHRSGDMLRAGTAAP
mmetsp:Transcript_36931/g.99442  ORF Transcript_36931/g.99442 Transcript_36931/m.99442 type:complete len:432 (+) Transcript_36931:155-1450(+)